MRLLIDETYPRTLAEQLRVRGHDAVAVTETPALVGLEDAPLLTWAHTENRAVVTENVSDFLALHASWLRSGQSHSGIILASNAAFPRARASTLGALVKALDELVVQHARLDTDICWLP